MSLSPIGLSMIRSAVDLLERTDRERQEMTMNSERNGMPKSNDTKRNRKAPKKNWQSEQKARMARISEASTFRRLRTLADLYRPKRNRDDKNSDQV
jgi:hypothetical protein